MNIEKIKERISAFEEVDFVGPVPNELIDQAETELESKFPPQYRAFISNFGCGGIGSEEFIGLGGAEYLNVSKMAARLRNKNRALPKRFLPLWADGFGNYDCIDVRQPTDGGEYAVVRWIHDAPVNEPLEVVANSYWEWFESILSMIENPE